MNANKKIITFSIVFSLIALLLILFGIIPFLKSIKEKSASLVEKKKEVYFSSEEQRKLEQIEKAYQDIEPDLEKISNLFVNAEFPVDIIRFWEKTAVDCQVDLKNISPVVLKQAETDPWGVAGFQLYLSGSFSDFLKFTEKIENGPYLAEVQNIIVNGQNDENISQEKGQKSSSGGVNATLLIKVFVK